MSQHIWSFFRAGGFDQVRITSGSDLASLAELDQKLWVALACPATGLEFDEKTLAMMDSDKDGRIRAPEVIAAAKWAADCLKKPDDLLAGGTELPLASINDSTAEGKQLLSSARQILMNLGKKDAAAISLEDVTDTSKIFAQTKFNGDGIVPADSAEDAVTQAVITDIITCLGAEMDRSGKPGVTQVKVDQFFADAQAYSDWWKKAEQDSSILPMDRATASAAAALKAVQPKVEDFYARCRLASFDSRAAAALNREEKEYLALAAKDLTITSAEIAVFPISLIAPAKALPLTEGINPAWEGAVTRFREEVVKPIYDGKISLQEADWASITRRFAPYEAWLATKAGASVEKLGLPRVREILAGQAKEAITGLIAKDKALEAESGSIASVEKLLRYYRHLAKLLNNFVSFRDFYSRKEKAVFQAGTLYLDQRSCDLCLRVEDPGKHAIMASLAGTYLAYCDCVRKATGEKMQIVAAFTDGDSDNLMVGRNGVFYDRKGRDWDATISKIIDNPISIRQAFWAPYKKAARMVQEQIAKRAAAADEAAVTRLAQAAAKVEKASTEPQPPPPPKKIDPGMVAALGVGAAGIGGMIGGIVTGFLNLKWMMPVGVLAIILAISGPSMLLAWLKLRKRNLGPILDANGWAVNAKAKINVPFGASLTRVATLPADAKQDLIDPFAEKKRPWGFYFTVAIVLFLAVAWWQGVLDRVLPGSVRSTSVLGTNAPAYKPVPAVTNAPVADPAK
jgi:hypothetical protein